MRNLFGKSFGLKLLGLSFFVVSNVSAQISTTPSASQINAFRQLPAAQQNALARQFGVDLNSIGSGGAGSDLQQMQQTRPEEQYLTEESQQPLAIAEEDEEELKPFGYDMFEQFQDAFLPDGMTPVPSDYVVGPGDSLKINLFGKESSEYELMIDNDGRLFVPGLSPLVVSGLTYQELKSFISKKVAEQIIGTQVMVSIANLRSIQVYVVGNAKKPGAYNLSSLSTLTNALFIAGGPNDSGSLRYIEVKRGGKTVSNYDMYDMFINGDVTKDVRLQQGDTVFIGSIKNQVSVTGEVRRPAIYEIKKGETVANIINMAGGLTSEAYPKRVLVAHLNEDFQRDISRINVNDKLAANRKLSNGDVITVMPISESIKSVVNVAGAVSRPSTYAWSPGMTIDELIDSTDDLLPTTDLNYALVFSEDKLGNFEVKQFKPKNIFGSERLVLNANDTLIFFSRFEQGTYIVEDEELEAPEGQRDQFSLDIRATSGTNNTQSKSATRTGQNSRQTITNNSANLDGDYFTQLLDQPQLNYLYTLTTGSLLEKQKVLLETKKYSRQQLIAPVIKLMSSGAVAGQLTRLVEVHGQVNFPGTYPISQGAKLIDVILAAGGLTESANLAKGEISRLMNGSDAKSIAHIDFNLEKALSGAEDANIELKAKDVVNIFQQANWQDELKVTLSGEVTYPGEYTIKEGETLSELLQRAGGLTSLASPEGAFFTREQLKELEERQAKNMARSLSKELALKSMSSSVANINIGEVQQLVNQLTAVKGVGRLVIDLPNLLKNKAPDVTLEDGDEIMIPSFRNEVNIIGEVQVATSHLHSNTWKLDDYIQASGGLSAQADDDRVYVIKANGLIEVPNDSWFFNNNLSINAGDTIVVPLDSGYVDRLTLWEKSTAIFYQLTVGLAALGRL